MDRNDAYTIVKELRSKELDVVSLGRLLQYILDHLTLVDVK